MVNFKTQLKYLLLFIIALPVTLLHANIQKDLRKLELSAGGRIGVFAINTGNNTRLQYRAKEHFPFQSTFKVIGVSAILKESMTNHHLLQQKITYTKQDLVDWSPITEKHLADGMTVSELCAATMMFSDNTAINLLMKKLGGPKAVTTFAHSIGDNAFKLDSWEPKLNSNPTDLRDTSTPEAMGKSLQQLALGNALATVQRGQLLGWLKANTTGNSRIRAGVPKDWIVGDKTGTGDYGITNDVGIIWPAHCPPIITAIYYVQDKKNVTPRDDVIASATQILIRALAQTDPCIKLSSMRKSSAIN